MEICVIYNPKAGRGRARERLARLRRALGDRAVFRPTEKAGHATELALQAASEGFKVIAAAGGDGTVHEVANGILLSGVPDPVLAVIPVGSANDYAHALQLSHDWWLRPDRSVGVRRVDVGRARAPDGRLRYFVNGLGLGFNGAVTIEARRIKNLQGVALYALAVLRAMVRRYDTPMLSIQLDDGEEQRVPTLILSVAVGRREGAFLMAPDAVIDDGLFDYLHVGRMCRTELIRHIPGVIFGRIPRHPSVGTGRCRRMTVRGTSPLIAHTDGEFFCVPEEKIHEIEIDLLPEHLRVFGRLPSVDKT